jgi:putative flippase GtrA
MMKNMIMRAVGDERARFVFVGAWNTVIGYAVFVLVLELFGDRLHPVGALLIAYCVALPNAFATQRWLVFRSGRGGCARQFVRFASANSSIILINLIFLPLVIELTHANPLFIQAIFIIILTLMSYIIHKYFSFAK